MSASITDRLVKCHETLKKLHPGTGFNMRLTMVRPGLWSVGLTAGAVTTAFASTAEQALDQFERYLDQHSADVFEAQVRREMER